MVSYILTSLVLDAEKKKNNVHIACLFRPEGHAATTLHSIVLFGHFTMTALPRYVSIGSMAGNIIESYLERKPPLCIDFFSMRGELHGGKISVPNQ